MQIILMDYEDETSNVENIYALSAAEELILSSDHLLEVEATLSHLKEQGTKTKIEASQINQSVQEVANYAISVAENVQHVMDTTQQNASSLQLIKQSIEEFVQSNQTLQKEFQILKESFEQVSSFSKEIREIASQTKILSLNASIEAARAGEKGSGFQVVAHEIRSLSDRTKINAEQIEKLLWELNDNAEKLQNRLREFEKLATDQKKAIGASEKVSNQLLEEMQVVMDTTSNIAANTEEQAASSQLVEQSMEIVIDQVSVLEKAIHTTGEDMYRISLSIEEMRQNVMLKRDKLPLKAMLRTVKTDHKLWKWNLYNMYLGYHHLERSEIGDHHRCRLGKWYDQQKNQQQFHQLPIFQEIEPVHKKLHEQALSTYDAIQTGNFDQIRNSIIDLEKTSEKLVSILTSLEKIV